MAGYFGFKPSSELSALISRTQAAHESGAPLKEQRDLRDQLVKDIVHELIGNLMRDVVGALPPGEKRESLLKVTDTVANTAEKLISQILGKDDQSVIERNYRFMQDQTLFTDPQGEQRVGFKMDPKLYSYIQETFAKIRDGKGVENASQVIDVLNQFTDAVLGHFMMGFSETLDLGFIKRKLLPVAHGAIMGGVKMLNKRLIPKLGQPELGRFEERYNLMMFEA